MKRRGAEKAGRRRVTLADVAREAAAGLGTVSRALSGRGAVDAGTRARVLAAAARLGYEPNAAARALAGQRAASGKEQVMVVYLRRTGEQDGVFRAACAAQGLSAGVASPEEFESPEAAGRALLARGVDGVLVASNSLGWGEAEAARFPWGKFAVVVLARHPVFSGFDLVRHSAFDYMRAALLGLKGEGFRRIHALLHRSVSPADDAARLGAVLEFAHSQRGEGVEVRFREAREGLREIPPGEVVAAFEDKWADAVLFDHFGFLARLIEGAGAGWRAIAGRKPFAAAVTADRNDPFFGGVSGCPVDLPQIYERAARALFEKALTGSKGRPRLPTEHVIEPVWEARESVRRRR